jgi:hypothetical protein
LGLVVEAVVLLHTKDLASFVKLLVLVTPAVLEAVIVAESAKF